MFRAKTFLRWRMACGIVVTTTGQRRVPHMGLVLSMGSLTAAVKVAASDRRKNGRWATKDFLWCLVEARLQLRDQLDFGLEAGLDFGLDFGLEAGLGFGDGSGFNTGLGPWRR